MIKVSELINLLTEHISRNVNVLDCYISIDDRNNVIRFTVPLVRKENSGEEEGDEQRNPV